MAVQVNSICFNPVLAKVHGSLIGGTNRKKDDLDLKQIKQVISGILSKDNIDVTLAKREIFSFLVVNTDLPWDEELLMNDRISSISKICKNLLKSSQLLDLVDSENLWESFFNCCTSLPQAVTTSLVESALQTLLKKKICENEKELPLWSLWTRLTNISFTTPSLQPQIVEGWLKLCLQKEKGSEEEKRNYLLSVLCVVRTCFDNVEPEIRNSLMLALKAMLFDLEFQDWIQLCEISSTDIMNSNHISGIWVKQDIPSNLQFIAAHLIYQIQQHFKGMEEDTMTGDLMPVLDQFAREYDRVLELTLDDLDVENLISILAGNKDKLDAWKIQAYLDKMLSFLPGILESEPCIQILIEYSEFLSQNIEIIYNHIQSLVQVKVSQLFVAHKSIKATVNSNKITLGKDDFETRFVEVLNRSGGGETDNINKEFIILAILDGKRTVSRLVDEATKNAGQTEAIAAILTNLDPVNCQDQDPAGGQLPEYLDTGAKPTYLGNLVAKAILEKRDKEQENGIKLFNLIRNYNTTIARQNVQMTQCCTVLELVVSCCNKQVLTTFNAQCLNLCQAIEKPEVSSKIVHRYLADQLISYFNGGKLHKEHLLYLVQSNYFDKQDNFEISRSWSSKEIESEIIACLIFLTKEEYPLFVKVIAKILQGKAEEATSVVECLEVISGACQLVALQQDLDQVLLRRILIGYSSLYTSVINTAEDKDLLKLYDILIKDIYILKDLSLGRNGCNNNTEMEEEGTSLLAPVWRSCQALVAELLERQPSEEVLNHLLVNISVTSPSTHKESVLRMITNFLDKN